MVCPAESRVGFRASAVVAVLVAFALAPLRAGAQTQQPNTVVFLPSADHRALRADGTPVVTGYALEVSRQGDARVILVIGLGKPEPAADSFVHAVLDEYAAMRLARETMLEARVVAVGPDGVGRSPVSNLFVFSGCAFVFPGSATVPAAGGTVTVPVRAPQGCGWTATTRDAWLRPGLPSSSGDGTVAIVAEANLRQEPRAGVVTIGSHVILIVQGPAGVGSSSRSEVAGRHAWQRAHDSGTGRGSVIGRAGRAPGFTEWRPRRDNDLNAVITSPVTTAAAVDR